LSSSTLFPITVKIRNPFGILTVIGNKVEEDKTVIDKLTIMKPIFDINDFEKKFHKARLTHDGKGLIATEPTIPTYLWSNPKAVLELVDEEHGSCDATFQTFKTIRTDMKKKRDLRTHEVLYKFPPGTTCNNEFFNKVNRRSSNYELDTELIVFENEVGQTEDGDKIVQFCPFVVWRMAIDGPGKQTEDEDDQVLNGATKAFARLGLKTKAGTSRMDEDL
jgi:hypothetical protein